MLPDRFRAKVWVDLENHCWIWTACKTQGGYGLFGAKRKLVLVHRFSYETMVGPIPSGMQLDHLCRNRLCVNPDHLEPVTCRENLARGKTLMAANLSVTECPKGHQFDELNTYVTKKGARQCRACARDRYHRTKSK
jgi:hypothetical protein